MRNPRSSQFFQDLMVKHPEFYSGNKSYNNAGRQESPSLMSVPAEKTPIVFGERTVTGPSKQGGYVPTPKTPNNEPRLMSMPTPTPVDPSLIFTAGTVDYSFPAGGGYEIDGFDGDVYDIKVDSSGRYLIGGNFGNYYYNGDNYYSPYLIRLNPDGTVDGTFNTTYNNDCYGGSFNGTVYSIEIQSDGKILVGGSFTQYDNSGNCWGYNRIIRLNDDATRDLTFSIGDGFDDEVYDLELQSDGKILVVGRFIQYNNTDAYRIIRLNSNGSIDSSFLIGDTNVSFNDYVNVVKIQSDGKILCGGYFTTYAQGSPNYIVRINSNGTIDTSFYVGNGFNDEVYTMEIQSDGKIIVGGYFDTYDNNDLFGGHIVRLNTNGSIDTLFGYGFDGPVHSLAIQSDGKILVGGNITDFYVNNYDTLNIDELVRFHSDCTFDYSFYYDELLNDTVESIVILSDGKILIGGQFGDGDPSVYPLNYFGRLNNSILPYKYTYLMEDCDQPLNDSTITYIVGSNVELNNNDAFSFNSLYNPSVVKCGTIYGGDYYNNRFYSNQVDYVITETYNNCDSARLANGKIAYTSDLLDLGEGYNFLVDNKYQVGDILYIDMVFDFIGGLAFIKTAVQIDQLVPYGGPGYFNSPIIPYDPYQTLEDAVVGNGIHYVAEGCNEDETNFPLIHKLYYDNTSLLIPTGTNPCKELVDVLTFAPYSQISEGTNTLKSTVEFETCDECLTKMGKSGLLDNTLYNNDFNGFVYTMVEQPDGKILVGGNFDVVNGNDLGSLVRLNTDGTIDETFNTVYCDQPVWSTNTPFSDTTSGSIYFDGTPLCKVSVNTDQPVWDLSNDNVTFEWFQYFTGDLSHELTPTAFDYLSNDLRVSFSQGYINVVIDGDNYSYELNSTINDVWCHIAITRYYDSDEDVYIWRVFQDGIQIGQFDYSFSFNQNDPLLIGGSSNPYDNRGFKGYITNFRVNNGEAIYTSDFDVPTSPLDPNYNAGGGNTVLCLSVNNETDYILDNCDDEIPTSVNSPGNFTNGGFNNYIRAIALQSDGKILVGGNFNYYNNSLAGKIIRLNSDGSIDNSFTFGNEFNGTVRAIAIQTDGKIVVGGDFDYYYDYYCNHIVRLNIDGTPDNTFVTGDGFDGSVFTLNIESVRYNPFYNGDPVKLYVDTIYVGGWFDTYNNVDSRGVAVLTEDGNLNSNFFGIGFNYDDGTPRVNQIFRQSDGKLIIIGGATDNTSSYLNNYQGTHIGQNIVRLADNGNGQYEIDSTFDVISNNYGEGGIQGSSLSITQQPDGKLIIGGDFDCYWDNNDNYCNLWNIVRINTDGSYDPTFSLGEGFDSQVNKVLLLSDGKLLTGGRYQNPYPTDYLTRLYIGESYVLRNFTDCDGNDSYVYTSTNYTPEGGMSSGVFSATTITYEPISTSDLDLIYDGNYDDDNFFIELPLDFDVNFLGTNYTSVYMGSNSYLTFGDGSNAHGINPFPGDIPNETELPGVYLSTRTGDGNCLDSAMWLLYTGTTDGGNTVIIRFEGNDDYDASQGDTNLVYNFKFYKDQSDYFDLIIEQNEFFCNDDPTGGVSNGVDETWITSFDTSSENAYRIGTSYTINIPVKVDFGSTPAICGQLGDVVTGTAQSTDNLVGGSMYFNGTDSSITISYDSQMDLNYGPWTIEWFQYYTSSAECCLRVFDIGSNGSPEEHIGASLENGNILVWIEGTYYSYTLNSEIRNKWCNFAISGQNIGGSDWVLRVYQNGVQLGSDITLSVDLDNFDGPTELPLTIGGEGNGNSPFKGYITNFRWTKGDCYYQDPTMNVPTSPLLPYNSQLLFLATDESGLLTNACEPYPNGIPASEISANNVTWSTNTPFGTFTLSTLSDTTSYDSCDVCNSSVNYNVTLYVRDGVNADYVSYNTMSKTDLDSILLNGPIFTLKAPKTYEILNFNL